MGEVRVVEPNIEHHPEFRLVPTEQAVADSDIVVLLVGHRQFKQLPPAIWAEKIVFDTCGALLPAAR